MYGMYGHGRNDRSETDEDCREENTQKELLSCKGKNIPILVLGPCLSHIQNGEEEYSINNYLNNIEIGFAN